MSTLDDVLAADDLTRTVVLGFIAAGATEERAVSRALSVMTEHDRTVKAEALRKAARDTNERGDIGKRDGVEAWDYLNARADRIEADHA